MTLQAERQPGVAVVGNNERLTYARLEERSNQLARLLKEAGCKTGDRVCLLMPKSPTAIVSLLGIYKAETMAAATRRTSCSPRDRPAPPKG